MKRTLLSFLFGIATIAVFAQVQMNKSIQLTGSGSDAKIEGIKSVVNDDDAASKKYVDTTLANNSGSTRYFMGDYHQGGIIVYVDSTQQHGYIAAKSIQSSGISWSNIQNSAVGPGAQSFTDGQANTAAIIAQGGHSTSAAKICDDYSNEGYSDWYLPAANELAGACRMQGLFFYMSFYSSSIDAPYWSSTENAATDPASRVVGVSFTDCNKHLNDNAYGMQKFQSYKVWCVRKF